MIDNRSQEEEIFIAELFAPLEKFITFTFAIHLSTQNFNNPSIHQSKIITDLIKSGSLSLYNLIQSLIPENSPEFLDLVKDSTNKIDKLGNVTLLAVFMIIITNLMYSIGESVESYFSVNGKKSVKLKEFKEKLEKLKKMTKLLDPLQDDENTILERYKLLFKQYRRRPTDEQLVIPTEKANTQITTRQKDKMITKIGRVKRKPTFIYNQIMWLNSVINDKRIRDSILKNAAITEHKRLGNLYETQLRNQEKYSNSKEISFNEQSYRPEDSLDEE